MAKFEEFIPLLNKVEGGYQNLAGDSGNYNSRGERVGTNHGISAKFYEGIIHRPPSIADMQNLSLATAKELYRIHFWNDVQGDIISNQSVANLICDGAVNGGEGTIGKIVQRVLVNDFHKPITIDGDIGIKTAQAINSVNQQLLFDKIKAGREQYYNQLGGEFLNGWLKRLKTFVYTEKKR